jgi:hypothetical protein
VVELSELRLSKVSDPKGHGMIFFIPDPHMVL